MFKFCLYKYTLIILTNKRPVVETTGRFKIKSMNTPFKLLQSSSWRAFQLILHYHLLFWTPHEQ